MFEKPAKFILHPTDFSPASENAFAHALAIAIRNQASLAILHVIGDEEDVVPWHDYPPVRETLIRWGHLDPGSSRRDVGHELGIRVKKTIGVGKNTVQAILDYIDEEPVDLIVMATEAKKGLPGWFKTDVALPLSQKSRLPTLFVPAGGRGCVAIDDGHVELNHVLLPVDHEPSAAPVMNRVVLALEKFGGPNATVHLLYVGQEGDFPVVEPPQEGDITWTEITRNGDPARQIVETAEEIDADMIAMVTEGKKDLMDMIRGSTTQQVLRDAECPVFTIPSDS